MTESEINEVIRDIYDKNIKEISSKMERPSLEEIQDYYNGIMLALMRNKKINDLLDGNTE